MKSRVSHRWGVALYRFSQRLRRPENLAILPALTLVAFWLGGEPVMVLTALSMPLTYVLAGAFGAEGALPDGVPRDRDTGLILREPLLDMLATLLIQAQESGATTACLVLRLDHDHALADRLGHTLHSEALRQVSGRMRATLRDNDLLARLDDAGFAVVLPPARRLGLEAVLQLAARLQSAAAAPVSAQGVQLHFSFSAGICLAERHPGAAAAELLEAAEVAVDQALANGPGAIRVWSPDLPHRRAGQDSLRNDLGVALASGQFVPYFQPQLSTDTGAITGFEALARWRHPERGMIAPAEFLPMIEAADLSERLGDLMIFQALSALTDWDAAGLAVPTVAVNVSQEQLRNPRFPEKIEAELGRFGLAPQRLTIEVLETVVADMENDVIVRNLARLARLGCGIDLDDFGVGQASIANIRRFAVRRIKIDRSFVARVDRDDDQRQMVAAILALADRLRLDTVAEGIETAGEHALMAQLGCTHVQGFGIGTPMPFEQTGDWIRRHNARLPRPPRLGRKTG